MAIINGQVPPPLPATEGDAPRRVVARLRSETTARAFLGDPAALSRESGIQWEQLSRAFPGVRPRPYFGGLSDHSPTALVGRAKTEKGRSRAARLARYVAIECPRGISLEEVAKAVAAWPAVETAYPDEQPTPPPVDATDDPRSANQGYLDAAPDGIDARWVWSATNVDGTGVGVVDMEQGWTLNHEDLADAGITLISGDSFAYHGHGTAVLGELVSVDNTLGCIGIAPGASARVVSQWRSGAGYNTTEAILSAVAVMNAGDVLLLEAQSSYTGASGYVPVEVYDTVFDAIEFATSEGIVVVEAAGNGSVDLDLFQDFDGKQILNRNSADFRDSGAIMIGAASSTTPHQRSWFTNFGSRIDCFGWGGNIDTCGDGWTGTSTSAYTSSFGGTSGASPIVTGAAVLLQAWRVGQGAAPFGPYVIRDLLSDAAVNTASAYPGADRIGVMPNLRAVIERQQVMALLNSRRWVAVALILFGVIQDGGGIIIKPGSGPIPIDPWGPLQPILSMHKRDVLAALAATEIASLLSDESGRKAVTSASLDAIGKAIENIRVTL